MNTIKILIEFIQPAVPAIVAGLAYAIGVRVGWHLRGEASRVRRQNHKPFRG